LGVDGIQPTHDYCVRVDIHRSRCYASSSSSTTISRVIR
jgi:hypothetical protein